jgi:hypothetical protein
MGLCTCFWRNSAITSGNPFYYSQRSFYLTGVLTSFSESKGTGCCCVLTKKPVIGVFNLRYALTFLCASYGSLYLLSSLKAVRLCDVLFLVTAKIIPTCVQLEKSYLLQCYKTHIFRNAYILSSLLATGIVQGLNVTYLLSVLVCKIGKTQDARVINIVGLGLIFTGRIKGHAGTRSISGIKALCVGSFSSRILDVGYVSSVTSLGLLGVKVGTVL